MERIQAICMQDIRTKARFEHASHACIFGVHTEPERKYSNDTVFSTKYRRGVETEPKTTLHTEHTVLVVLVERF